MTIAKHAHTKSFYISVFMSLIWISFSNSWEPDAFGATYTAKESNFIVNSTRDQHIKYFSNNDSFTIKVSQELKAKNVGLQVSLWCENRQCQCEGSESVDVGTIDLGQDQVKLTCSDLKSIHISSAFRSKNGIITVTWLNIAASARLIFTPISYASDSDCGFYRFKSEYFLCSDACDASYHDRATDVCIDWELVCSNDKSVPSCGQVHDLEPWDNQTELCHLNFCPNWLGYLYMMFSMMALIFILVLPGFLIYFLYNRRQLRAQRTRFDMELEQTGRTRIGSQIFVVSSNPKDTPPDYEEIFDTKSPPPCFCSVVGAESSESASQSQTNCSCSKSTTIISSPTSDDVPSSEDVNSSSDRRKNAT